MDRRQVFGWIGVLLCIGVPVAWALTGSFSDSIWYVPNMTADTYTVGPQTLAQYIATVAPGGVVNGTAIAPSSVTVNGPEYVFIDGQTLDSFIDDKIAAALSGYIPTPPGPDPSAYNWNFWKVGSTYWARDEDAGTNSSNTNFATLWDNVKASYTVNDVLHFTGNTEYITNKVLQLTTHNVTLIGDVDPATGLSTSSIRAYSSTAWTGSYMFDVRGDDDKLIQMNFNGLGYIDGRDWAVSYSLVYFGTADDTVVQNCTIEHTQQYALQFSECDDVTVKNNTVRYAQNGVALGSTTGECQNGVIEYNYIHDCSQAPIKLRGCNNTIVRYNDVHNEYTYWRSFDHYSYPGTDGRGITGHSGTAAQGIYFGLTDPNPCYDVDIYNNTITDASVHGTILVTDVVDSTTRYGPTGSQGCRVPLDTTTPLSNGNKFHDNVVTGCYYSVWVQNYTTRPSASPTLPLEVYDNTFTSIISSYCYLS